jgi:hypothetical protein
VGTSNNYIALPGRFTRGEQVAVDDDVADEVSKLGFNDRTLRGRGIR